MIKTVALISHSPHMTGAERMLTNLAVLLKQETDFRPVVLIPDPEEGTMVEHLCSHGIEWYPVPKMMWYIHQGEVDLPDYMFKLRNRATAYANALRAVRADIGIVNTLTNLEGVLGCHGADMPFLLWIHGIIDSSMVNGSAAVRDVFDKTVLNFSSAIMTCSNWTSDFYRKIAPHKTIETVHNWTDMTTSERKERPSAKFSALSTLEPHKGIDVLIEAAALLKEEGRSISVNIYGSGRSETELRQLARDKGVDTTIKFHGRTSDVQTVYENSTATLMPSYIEPFGMVAIESMAIGTPVIAAAVGGLVEIIEERKSGLLFPPGDAAALAASMRTICDDAQLVNQLREAGTARIDKNFRGKNALTRIPNLLHAAARSFNGYGEYHINQIDLINLLCATGVSCKHQSPPEKLPSSAISAILFPIDHIQIAKKYDPTSSVTLCNGPDLTQVPLDWYSFEVMEPITSAGIEFMLLSSFNSKSNSRIIAEIVRENSIVAQCVSSVSHIQGHQSCRLHWPRLNLHPGNIIWIRFGIADVDFHDQNVSLLEWRSKSIRCPLFSMFLEKTPGGIPLRPISAMQVEK